jgi:hypothetical protein
MRSPRLSLVQSRPRWNQGWGETGDREKSSSLAREAIADDPAMLRWAEHTLGFSAEYHRERAVLEKSRAAGAA